MQPLTNSLTPSELSEALALPQSTIDAWIDSGALLCHLKDGESRVPLAQIETLLRDALLRLYRIEATATHIVAPEITEPAPLIESERDDIETPQTPLLEIASPAPLVAVPAPLPPPIAEQRHAPRYVPLRQITGIFGDTKFTIVQMSSTGLRIRHREPLMPGDEAKVSFALMKPARSFMLRARVVWTSLARSGDDHVSISGLRIIEHADRLARAVELLQAAHELQRERRLTPRRESDVSHLTGISDDEIALVTGAMRRFANDPVEASRWYSRARFALADEEVRRIAPPRPRDREEVLGIWEYLERQIDLVKVTGVVTWARGA